MFADKGELDAFNLCIIIMPINCIIFDYDDTLVASSEYLYNLENRVSAQLGLTLRTREQYFSLYWKPHIEMVQISYPDFDSNVYMQKYDELYNPNDIKPFDKTLEILQKLHAEWYKLWVLSWKIIAKLKEHMELLGISSLFDYIHWAESSSYKKPDSRVFNDIIEHFQPCVQSDIAYIWDNTIDYIAANNAWLQFIWITTGIHSKEDFEKLGCKNILSNIGDLDKIIKSLW